MKIAMITPGLLPVPAVRGGAVEVLTEYLIDGNERVGNNEIDLYTVYDERIKMDKYIHTNIILVQTSLWTKIINKLCNSFYRLFRIKKWHTSFNREVIKLLNKKEKYDLVVIQNNILVYEDVYKKTKNKDNLVYVMHNDINDGDLTHIRIGKLVGDTANKVLAVSEYTKNSFLEISPNANVDVLYNCIDLDMYATATEGQRKEYRKKYSIDTDEYVYMYSGRIDVYKGVLELIKAFKRLDGKDNKLLIVGKSWFDESNVIDEYTQLLIHECEDVKERIVFTGFVNPTEMPYMYRMADYLVIPSMWEEPFGVVALEGMASKLPIIATKSGGLVEILDSDKTMLVEKNQDVVNNLCKAMAEVKENKDYYVNCAEENYEKVVNSKTFSKTNYYNNFCNLIKE